MARVRGIKQIDRNTNLVSDQLISVESPSLDTIFSTDGTQFRFVKEGIGTLAYFENNKLLWTQNGGTTNVIGTNSVDGTDDRVLLLSSNSNALPSRGAFVRIGGNESVNPGDVDIEAGNAANGVISLRTHNATGSIDLYTQNILRWKFNSDGHLIPQADNTYDIGSLTNRLRSVYADNLISGSGGSLGTDELKYTGISNSYLVYADTSDGTDNKSIVLSGGGAAATNRGSQLFLYGNEVATFGGQAILRTGDVTSGNLILNVKNTSASLLLQTNDITKWSLTGAGHIIPAITGTYDIGSPSLRVANIYADNLISGGGGGSLSTLANETFLKGRNFANTADVGLIKIDINDDTVISSDTGDLIKLSNIAGSSFVTEFDYANQVLRTIATSGISRIRNISGALTSVWAADITNTRATIGTETSHDLYFLINNLNRWYIDTTGRLAEDPTNGNGILLQNPTSGIEYNNASGDLYFGAIQSNDIRFYTNNVNRWRIKASTGALEQDATNGGDVILNRTIGNIRQGTSDGSDNGIVNISGGGDALSSRGAYISISGNEHTNQGKLNLVSGGVSGSDVIIQIGSASNSQIQFKRSNGNNMFTMDPNTDAGVNTSLFDFRFSGSNTTVRWRVTLSVVANGTTIATATTLTTDTNEVTSAVEGLNDALKLPNLSTYYGKIVTVVNTTNQRLNIFPEGGTSQIDNLGTGNPYVLFGRSRVSFIFAKGLQWYSVSDNTNTAFSIVENEIPTGNIDGINTIYNTLSNFITSSLKVYHNGLRMIPGASNDFTVTGNNQFTFNFTPQSGDTLLVDYRKS